MVRSFVLIPLLVLACASGEAAPPAAPVAVVVPAVRVAAGEKLLFRYFEGDGKTAKTADSIDAVPAAAREAVIAIPETVEVPAGHVILADLRTPGADGTYPYRMVAQSELDAELARLRAAAAPAAPVQAKAPPVAAPKPTGAAQAKSGTNDVVMFTASWCGVCTQARRWFRNKGIEIVERDVEEDPKAQADMAAYAQKAGVDPRSLTGVPVIWANGQLFPGFDPGRISGALN